jgi:hypothetical protein
MSPSANSYDGFSDLWESSSWLSFDLESLDEEDCVPVSSIPLGSYTLSEEELRALQRADDDAYDELIRECTEEHFNSQRDGASTPPLTRTRTRM